MHTDSQPDAHRLGASVLPTCTQMGVRNKSVMNYFTLCMAPALDVTVTLPQPLRGAGEVFKDVNEVETPGGKGLNVAHYLAWRGAQVACGGLLGAANAEPFERMMASRGITDKFVRVKGTTRRNETITWPGGSMKLNRSPFPNLDKLPRLEELLAPCDVAILSGALPKCYGDDFYAQAICELKKRGAFTVLDASGVALQKGTTALPDVIKPNAEECAALVGFVPQTPDDFIRATRQLKNFCDYPIISDGANGCWFNGELVETLPVRVVDATAAGDVLLAEWCYSRNAQRAVAAAAAVCTVPGCSVC